MAQANTAQPTHDQEARIHVRELTKRSGTSFFWAMRLLPPERRYAMYAIYAFCREVDDIADEGRSPEEKAHGIEAWRAAIEELYAGAPRLLITQALQHAVRDYQLPKDDFLAIIAGMEMDAIENIRAPSLSKLERYCARVAGAVGLLSVRTFGDSSETALKLALAEGKALQLTNILRDLREDADRGRLYLPRELLEKHGIATDDPASVLTHPRLGKVCDDLAAITRASYDEAERLLDRLDRRTMRPALIMLSVYRRTLDALVARGWDDLDADVGPSKFVKLYLAVRHGFF
ncbi:MAG TPA: presqualene diphosphate synthase HpnD [Alphaproteobacteria bacterium]|nr:presqualene diphosphate synthase HpnD [Alphaproteobacteria bacterium]